MADYFNAEMAFSRYRDDKTIPPPWNQLVDYLCNMIPRDALESLISLARQVLGSEYHRIDKEKNCYDFFNTLQDKLKEDNVEFVYNLFLSCNDLHDDTGSVSFSECIRRYQEAKHKYDKQKKQYKNENFVGREDLVARIIGYLEQGKHVKGVILCGMSGVGKTAVAVEVCSKLRSQRPCWKILRISEMEKMDIKDLYRNLICALVNLLPEDYDMKMEDNHVGLKIQLRTVFAEAFKEMIWSRAGILIHIDGVDCYCVTKQQLETFRAFIEDILRCLAYSEVEQKVCFLVTVGRRVVELLGEETVCFGGDVVQIEVPPLSDTDAGELLRKISRKDEKTLPDEMCQKINADINGNTLALKQVAMNLIFTPASQLHLNLEMSTKLHVCLQKSFEMLECALDQQGCPVRQILINLSLFKSTWFTFKDAMKVGMKLDEKDWGSMFDRNHEYESKMCIALVTLRYYHLIEIDAECIEDSASMSKVDKIQRYYYSLHPLVYEYIHNTYIKKEAEENADMRRDLQDACVRFMQHILTQIDECGKEFSKKPHIAQAMLEKNKVHIRLFYEYFVHSNTLMSTILKGKENAECPVMTNTYKYLWNMMEFVQSAETRINFAKRLSLEGMQDKNLYQFVYWKCKEVEFLMSVSKPELACITFTDLSNKVQTEMTEDIEQIVSVLSLPVKEDEKKLMQGIFFETKARTLKEENKGNKDVVKYLQFAEKNYKSRHRDDRARVINLIGQYYFDTGDLEKSRTSHWLAFKCVEKILHPSENEADLRCTHLKSSEYLTNIAACDHQLATQSKDKATKEQLLQRALKKYNICIECDQNIKKDILQPHAIILMNRAEVLYQLNDLEQAMKDAEKSLKIFQNFYSVPNALKTLAYGQNAYFYYKLGKRCDNQAERRKMLEKSVKLYDDALCEITHGGLPVEHREFKDIKDFHIKAMKVFGMSEKDISQRTRKYSDFILGKYDAKIHKIRLSQPGRTIDDKLQEFKKKGILGVVVSSMREAEGDPEDHIAKPVSSGSGMGSSEKKGAESSSAGHTSDEDNAELDLMIEQVIYRKRRDSGVEMEDQESAEIIPRNPDGNTGDALKTESNVTLDEERDMRDKPQTSGVSNLSQEKATETLKRVLPRQESIDMEGSSLTDPSLGTSSFVKEQHLPLSSFDTDTVGERARKRRKSNVDVEMEDERRASTSTNRSSLSSIGSQDSVTSQLDRRLNLESSLSVQEEESDRS